MKLFTSAHKHISGIFILLLISGFVPCKTSFADIAANTYCQLSIQCLQQEISNFEELITLVNQYQNDRDTLNQMEELKKVDFAQARDANFASFGITATEYGTYMGSNHQAVNKFLEDNPVIKQQIEELEAQVNSLMEQYESLKGEETPEPDEPPMD